jgi:hypothetical protein
MYRCFCVTLSDDMAVSWTNLRINLQGAEKISYGDVEFL